MAEGRCKEAGMKELLVSFPAFGLRARVECTARAPCGHITSLRWIRASDPTKSAEDDRQIETRISESLGSRIATLTHFCSPESALAYTTERSCVQTRAHISRQRNFGVDTRRKDYCSCALIYIPVLMRVSIRAIVRWYYRASHFAY